MPKPFKIVVVGDGAVGKTCLLIRYTSNDFPMDHIPTIYENHTCQVIVDEKEYTVTIWDTAGQEDYENLRLLSYPNTNCFLVCYSIDSKNSLENIESKWIPELKKSASQATIVLVGTKSDLRIPGSDKYVTMKDAKAACKRIGGSTVVECSALKKENLDMVFEEAIRAVERRKNQGCCPS